MRTQSYIDTKLSGINTGVFGTESGAEAIENLRWDSLLKCWSNDRVLVPYDGCDTEQYFPTKDIYSIFSWTIRNSTKEYILYEALESDGTLTLYVRIGQTTHTLKTGRHKQSANEVTTHYVNFGSCLFIINGYDTPLVYFGDKYVRPVVFAKPNTVNVTAPESAINSYQIESIGKFPRYGMRTSGGILYQFPVASGYGMGLGARAINFFDGTADTFYAEQVTNTYEYVVSFISDTGSETSLSGRSNRVSWVGGGLEQEDDVAAPDTHKKVITATYGLELRNIPSGPPGTVKRRIYRTKNMGDERGGFGEEIFYLTDLNDNRIDRMIDAIPDTQLGSLGPVSFERVSFPSCTLGAVYQGRLVLAGIKDNPLALYISDAGLPEQFQAQNILNVNSKRGGIVTALVPYNNLLLVFRENAIDALIQGQSGFQLVPIADNIGSVSPHTIQPVQGMGTIFLGTDSRFYTLQGNFSGGSQIEIRDLSTDISGKLIEINRSGLQRAFAIYSAKEREYWCHVPTEGLSIPLTGFIWHTDIGGWSQRTSMPLSSATITSEGYPLFGSFYKTYGDLSGSGTARGLLAWAGLGGDSTRLTAIYETPWLSLGSPDSIKQITNIEFFFYKNQYQTSGANVANVTITGSVDYKPYERTVGALSCSNTETSSPGILDTAIVDGADNSELYNWDQNRYSDREVVTVRLTNNTSSDVGYWESSVVQAALNQIARPTGGCRWYKLKLTSTDKEMRLLGFVIQYNINGEIQQWSSKNGAN